MTSEIELLAPDRASDEALVDALVRLINEAYALGEAGLWLQGVTRTGPREVGAAIRNGEVLTAVAEGGILGCAHVRRVDGETAELGLVSTEPRRWGGGIGSQLVRLAEELMRSRGVTAMQLELLVPKRGVHPQKERLRGWYARLGYRVVRSAPFEAVAAHPASQLAVPCEFLIFRKPLADAPQPS